MRIAIIGTAGRRGDADRITLATWSAMLADARQRVEAAQYSAGTEPLDVTLVSGGAPDGPVNVATNRDQWRPVQRAPEARQRTPVRATQSFQGRPQRPELPPPQPLPSPQRPHSAQKSPPTQSSVVTRPGYMGI